MFQHDLQHTGRSPYSGPVTATLLWSIPVSGTSGSPAIGSDGTIYLPVGMVGDDTDGYLYAINPNGTQKWRIQLDILPSSSAPAIGPDGTIYVHGNGNEGNVVAIEKLHAIMPSGAITWTFNFNGGAGIFTSDIQSSPAVAPDGAIYVGSMDTNLYALNPDGTIKWAHSPTTSSINTSPAVAPDGTVYVHDEFGFYAYDSSGTEKWHIDFNVSGADGSPSIGADGTVYFAHLGNKEFYAIKPDGTLRWHYTLGFAPNSTPAIAADGTIYIGDDYLYALNPNGTLKWQFPSRSVLFSNISPIIGANGTIYWRETYTFYAVNPNGTQAWSFDVAPFRWGLDSTAALSSNWTLYVPTVSGLSAYRAAP
jgi:hypothetical protein